MRAHLAIALLCVLATPALVRAQPKDDGYCDFVEGVASSQAATQIAPALIGAFGYLEQPLTATNPDTVEKGARIVAGAAWRLSGIFEGAAILGRGHADCRRHKAFGRVTGETSSRALAARVAVYDDALAQAEKILIDDDADYAAHRTTAQEATATRVRVEELRELAAEDKRQLSALPAPSQEPLAGALAAYRAADADVERNEARIRRDSAIDVIVKAGIDEYLNRDTSTPFFAVLQVSVNLGILFQGSANERAAAGRKRLVESGHGIGMEGTVDQLRATIDIETKRARETEALVTELDRQREALAKIGGDETKRYKQTVWFEWVKAKAQLAYLTTHVESMRQVLGAESQ